MPRLPLEERSSIDALLALPIATADGPAAARSLRDRARLDARVEPRAKGSAPRDLRDRRRGRRDRVAGVRDAGDEQEARRHPRERRARSRATTRCSRIASIETAIKWDGEWQVTIEVFRDLGLAFAVVLVLIYVLVVGWFRSFKVPLVIMAPIPLTLIGILPGHAISGAFFTATSMIGMIALAGIIVRNSILLVDFIQLAEARGRSLRDAVLEAGAVRFRPIALTAAAVVVGGLVMVARPDLPGPRRRAHERRRRCDAAHHDRRSDSVLGASPA